MKSEKIKECLAALSLIVAIIFWLSEFYWLALFFAIKAMWDFHCALDEELKRKNRRDFNE